MTNILQRYRAARLALAAILLAGCGSRPAPGPLLAVDRTTHEFPPALEGAPVTEFLLTNVGSAPLKIERIESSCGCTTADAGQSELAPGETTTLRVRVGRPGIGLQKATVSIYSNSTKDNPASLDLTCWAYDSRPRIVAFLPRRIVLRNLDGEDQPGFEITAFERAGKRLIRSAECDPPFVVIVEESAEEGPTTSPDFVQRNYRFVAALMEQHPFGRFEGKVTFQLQRQDADKGPREFVLPIQVVAVPPLYADPDLLFATKSPSGAAPEWRVRIKRRSKSVTGKPVEATCSAEWLAVELQDAPAEGLEGDPPDVSSAAVLVVRMTRSPAANAAGAEVTRAEVTVKSDDPELPDIKILLVVSVSAERRQAASRD